MPMQNLNLQKVLWDGDVDGKIR